MQEFQNIYVNFINDLHNCIKLALHLCDSYNRFKKQCKNFVNFINDLHNCIKLVLHLCKSYNRFKNGVGISKKLYKPSKGFM